MQASHARAPQLFDTFVSVLNAAGVVWIFALMFLIGADITARALLDDPIAGVTEMVSLSLVACVFLQLAHAVLHGRLMRVEMFLEPLARRHPVAASVWNVLFAVLGIGILLTIVLGSWPDFVRAWDTNEFAGVEGIFTIQVWPIKLLIVVGCAVASIELARQLVVHAGRARAAADPRRWFAVAALALGALLVAALWSAEVEPRTVGICDDRARRRADRARLADRVRAVPHGRRRPRAREARCR